MRSALLVIVISTVFVAACASGRFGPKATAEVPEGPRTLKKLTTDERRRLLQRAHVWQPINTASLNMLAGPPVPAAQRVAADVKCTYVFPDKPLSGNTPKFRCELAPKDVVKIKYGDTNAEVYSEVVGSRLLWALGFKADGMYPARVTCIGCPSDPFAASKAQWSLGKPGNVGTRVFDPAAVEREISGTPIEVPGFEGWAWPELDIVDEEAGGARRAHVDALKLLAVFIQHSDSKPEQQELLCAEGAKRQTADGPETCTSPWLVVKDLGTTFGKATRLNTSKMTLADWSEARVWKEGEQCVGDMPRSFTGSLENPRISESGRLFLAQRLMLLSEKQIRDLFTAANVERRNETIAAAGGASRPVTVEDWARVFERKRDEIVKARCPA
jgi:hypothetical protein